jgi:hypothetical protein
MKKLFAAIITAIVLCHVNVNLFAQVDESLISKFLGQAKAAGDSQLGGLASELTDKIKSFGTSLADNAAVKGKLNDILGSLTGGKDSAALTSVFNLADAAKLTPQQVDLAKQVGNVASAYVVQKNFAKLDGAQGDVATIVSSLRAGKITPAIPAIKNVAGNAHLTDTQKQLISSVADKYAPGWQKAKGAMDSLKKLPGFGN